MQCTCQISLPSIYTHRLEASDQKARDSRTIDSLLLPLIMCSVNRELENHLARSLMKTGFVHGVGVGEFGGTLL